MSDIRNRKGFTLIELIVILAIIAILAAVLVPRFTGFTQSAKEKAIVSDAKIIITAAATVFSENPTIKLDEIEDKIMELTGSLEGDLDWTGADNDISFVFVKYDLRVIVTDSIIGNPETFSDP